MAEAAKQKRVLIVLTSHNRLGDTGLKTGFWLEELAAPYYVFKDAGVEIVLASPEGGKPPLDPKSSEEGFLTPATQRFELDQDASDTLAQTVRLAEISEDDFDAVFYPGGHGPLWDLANDNTSIALIEKFEASGKPMGFVCHAPGVLKDVKSQDGKPLVFGKSVTGFSNSEEDAVQLTKVVPFLVEDMLKENGGDYAAVEDWTPHVVEHGKLVTGQNPASSEGVAVKLLAQLG